MRTQFTVFIFLTLLCFACSERQEENTFKKLPKAQRIEKAFELEFLKTKDAKTNSIPSHRLKKARAVADRMRQEKSSVNLNWEERGPSNVGGRTRALIYDLNDPTGNAVFAGGVGGGLWKTTNINAARPDWTPINDFWENIAISAMAQDENNPNIIYVGTGEGWYNLDAIRGNGIWKSTDGGNTFSRLASTNNTTFSYVNRLAVADNGVVFAAVRSVSVANSGLYRSTDGGQTWNRVLFQPAATIATDIRIASNGDIYATMAGTEDDGIYKSTDNGLTWDFSFGGFGSNGRVEIATAPSDPNVVYALFENNNGIPPIYKTTDGGNNWVQLNTPRWYDQGNCNNLSDDWTRGQSWYDLTVIVDPQNADAVYIGAIDLFKSTNGGNSWAQISHWFEQPACGYPTNRTVHADQHTMVFKPGSNSELLFGNDGGVYQSTNANTFNPDNITFNFKSYNYNVTQFYACATTSEDDTDFFLAGAQDNGSRRFNQDGINTTREVSGGDGAFCHIDEDDSDIQITSYVYNNYFIANDKWQSGNSDYVDIGNEGLFINPTDYDSRSNTLFASHAENTYAYITNVGGRNNSGTYNNRDFDGKVSAVTCSPNVTNRVFFGTWNGKVVKVDNAHRRNSRSTVIAESFDIGRGFISCVAVEKGNDDHLLVTFSNYGKISVWETTNGGTRWTNVEGNLPDMPVRWAAFVPERPNEVVLATELGIWYTSNLAGENTNWQPSNNGLANTRIDMLQFRGADNLLLAATHGRGLYTTDAFTAGANPIANLSCGTLGTLSVNDNQISIENLQIENTGDLRADSTTLGVYLSADTDVTTNDIFVGEVSIPAIDPASAVDVNFQDSLSDIPDGIYYVGILSDYKKELTESNEQDNSCFYAQTRVNIGGIVEGTNLRSDAIGTLAFNNNRIDIAGLSIRNEAFDRSGASSIAYYLSTDTTITTADIRIGEDAIPALGYQETTVKSFRTTLPVVAEGTYYVGAIIDYRNQVNEIDETDNIILYQTPTIAVRYPNLLCGDLGTLTTTESDITITDLQINNNGSAAAGASSITYYLSTDTEITTGDTRLGADNIAALNANATATQSTTFAMPNLPAGTYYVGIILDEADRIAESNESDNTCYWNSTFTIESTIAACGCPDGAPNDICEDFASYQEGPISPQSDCWMTWSGEENTTEEAIVEAYSDVNDNYLSFRNGGQQQDVVLQLGDLTENSYVLSFYIYLFSGDRAYYNLLHEFAPGSFLNQWAQDVYFDGGGFGRLRVGNEDTFFFYSEDQWVGVQQYINLDENVTELYIDGVFIKSWPFNYQVNSIFGTKQLSAMNFYTFDNAYRFFIDDIYLTEVDFFAPNDLESRSQVKAAPLANLQQANDGDLKMAVSLSPNPTTGLINLQLASQLPQEAVVTITDVAGKKVYDGKITINGFSTHQIDLSAAAEGIYLLNVQTSNNTVTEQLLLMK